RSMAESEVVCLSRRGFIMTTNFLPMFQSEPSQSPCLSGCRSQEWTFRIGPSRAEQQPPVADSYLDGLAYHVFRYRDEQVLYDLNTTTICLIDALAFDVLSRANQLTKASIEMELVAMYDSDDLAKAFGELDVLRKRGFFTRPTAPSPEEMDKRFQTLLNHSPRRIQLLVAQRCNLKCTYCYAEEQGSNQLSKLMDWTTAKAAI